MSHPSTSLLSDAVLSAVAASDDPEALAAVLPTLRCSQGRVPAAFWTALDRHGLLESCWRDLVGCADLAVATDWLYRFGDASDARLLLLEAEPQRVVDRYMTRVSAELSPRDAEIVSVCIDAVETSEQLHVVAGVLASDYRRMSGAVPGDLVVVVARRAIELDVLGELAVSNPVLLEAAVTAASPSEALTLLDASPLRAFTTTATLPALPCPTLFEAVVDAAVSAAPEVTAARAEKIGCLDPSTLWNRFGALIDAVRAAHGDTAAESVTDEVNPRISMEGSTCLWFRFSDILTDLASPRPPAVADVVAAVELRTTLTSHLASSVSFATAAADRCVDPHAGLRALWDSKLHVASEHAVRGLAARHGVDAAQTVWALRVLLSPGPEHHPLTLRSLARTTTGGLGALAAAVVNTAARSGTADAVGALSTFGLLDDDVIGRLRSTVVFRSPAPFSTTAPSRSSSARPAGPMSSSSPSPAEMVGRWLLSRFGPDRLVLAAALASDELTLSELVEVCRASTPPV